MTITVGLDVTAATVGQGGVARYANVIWKRLAGRQDLEVRAFAAGRGPQPELPVRRMRLPLRVVHPLWRFTRLLSAEGFVGKVDVVHSIDLIPPPTRAPLVMTVHDVICITHPHLIAPRSARLQRLQLKAARRADVVLTTCHATADAISALADVPSSRIVVASPGRLGGGFREDNPRPIREPYLLAVGALTPRKGFDVLAEAVSRLNKSMPILVVAGPDGWHAELVKQRLRAPDVAARVRLLGPVDDETLESLYQHAVLVCHPSRAEGFGIPCLEAMGFGKALVATDLPSTREIADGCARLVPVDDPSALVEAISELVADPHLRLNLGKQACARAVGFTWDATVESVVGAYRIATRQSGS